VRLTDSLEFQDATLLESLSNYIHYNTTMKSQQVSMSSRLSEMIHRSKRKLIAWARARAKTRASFCYSRLGETSSLGQKQ